MEGVKESVKFTAYINTILTFLLTALQGLPARRKIYFEDGTITPLYGTKT